jgi:hypothetical protein
VNPLFQESGEAAQRAQAVKSEEETKEESYKCDLQNLENTLSGAQFPKSSLSSLHLHFILSEIQLWFHLISCKRQGFAIYCPISCATRSASYLKD